MSWHRLAALAVKEETLRALQRAALEQHRDTRQQAAYVLDQWAKRQPKEK